MSGEVEARSRLKVIDDTVVNDLMYITVKGKEGPEPCLITLVLEVVESLYILRLLMKGCEILISYLSFSCTDLEYYPFDGVDSVKSIFVCKNSKKSLPLHTIFVPPLSQKRNEIEKNPPHPKGSE